MILTCPSCGTSFLVNNDLIGDGREVRCGKCENKWFVEPKGGASSAAEQEREVVVDAMPNLRPSVNAIDPDMPDEADIPMNMPVPRDNEVRPVSGGIQFLATMLIIAVVVTSFLTFRNSLAATMPGVYAMLGMAPTAGLALADVELREKPSRTKARYIVEGYILNTSETTQKIPTLHVALLDNEGGVVLSREYLADQDSLEPGESYPFKASRLDTTFGNRVTQVLVELGNGVELMLRN